MAARWGAGDETLTACNMEFFPMETLDQTTGLSSEETLEVLQSCLDPSILSIFEDTPTVETKGLDEENEATLLTALTEILDNVDDENLSPFDTLPDSDLLSNQKGRELSPLRRMLCLSRSPQEKDSMCNTRSLSTGKSLSRMLAHSLQRSDGEEEEDLSLTLSPESQGSFPEHDQLDWEGLSLPLPVTLEQEGEDGLAVNLGDFVRHMHPYCMAISVENEHGEQMLPEGGIILEVVDQGENGEPIFAIQNMDLPVSVPLKELPPQNEQKDSNEAEEVATDSSEHIIVDDDDGDGDVMVDKALVKTATSVTPDLCSDVKDEIVLKRQKEDIKTKSPSRRKKKKKCKDQEQLKPAEGRVLRSGTVRKAAEELPKHERKSVRKEKRVAKVPPPAPSSSCLKSKPTKPCQTETKMQQHDLNGKITTPSSPAHDTVLLSAAPEEGQPICSAAAVSSQQTCETAHQPVTAYVEAEGPSATPPVPLSQVSSENSAAAPSSESPEIPSPVSMPPAAPEPKPKSLSLEEYRRLRQQKKPAPVEKQDNNSTKWPSLPELPKELPPIPCLPDPNPKDPRRANPQAAKKEVGELRPAWQPRGPGAPPTPEALLVPPAYMISSSSKVAAATTSVPKPQQTTDPSRLPPKPPTTATNSDTHPHTTAPSAVPSLKPITPNVSSVDRNSSHVVSGTKAGVSKLPQSQSAFPESVQLTKISPKTTTDVINSTSAPCGPHKTTVSQEVPEVTASTSLNNSITNDIKSSRPTISSNQSCSTVAALLPGSHCPKDVIKTREKPTTAVKPQSVKSATQELIEEFTSEIGIEASDLTSLLEQFEETQAKEEQYVPEVSGRAAAVGNSSAESVPEKTIVERIRANDVSSTAALTPPATPPHQMWKPLAPVTLLGRNKAPEPSKSSPSKVIQIKAQPLPSVRSRMKPTVATSTVAPHLVCMDHDYCLPNKGASTGESGKRWNVKQQSSITIKPIQQQAPTSTQTPPTALASSLKSATNHVAETKTEDYLQNECLEKKSDGPEESSVLDTPDASPSRQESESTFKVESPRRGQLKRSYRQHAASRSPSPRCSPKERTVGRSRKRRSHRSPSPTSSCSDSYSSRSRSPEKKRYRPRNSSSSSCSSRSSSRSSLSLSRSPPRRRRHSYSSSRSGSWSRSRSRSQSPQRPAQWGRSRQLRSPSCSHGSKMKMEEIQRRKEKAIEERRVVYVGRIRGTMTQRELRERFLLFGEIEECTLHFRDHGDNYGFVTYYDTKDAFTAIENGSKLRKPDELPFDLCFGGRRQFCQSSYSDLDSNREYDPLPAKGKYHALDFDTLLKQAQQNLKR